eukprot:5180369-Pyramimonas_sp.AAC.1
MHILRALDCAFAFALPFALLFALGLAAGTGWPLRVATASVEVRAFFLAGGGESPSASSNSAPGL